MRDLIPLWDFDSGMDDIFNRLHTEVFNAFKGRDSFLDFAGKSSYPKVNVVQKGSDLVFQVAIPNYNPENVDVLLEGDTLTINGKTIEDKKEDGDYLYREVSQRAFSRSWKLPRVIEQDAIQATYEKGMLFLTVKGAAPEIKKEPNRIKIEYKK